MSLQHLFTRIMAAASMAMALPLLAQEAKEKTPTAAQQAMMEAWQKAATPGSNHKLLAGLTGYDNVAKHFTATWADNMGTAIMLMTGTYDPTSKTFTYKGDMDDVMNPGTKVKVRQTVKILSDDSHVMEWYESRGGKEIKTMEITYTRQK